MSSIYIRKPQQKSPDKLYVQNVKILVSVTVLPNYGNEEKELPMKILRRRIRIKDELKLETVAEFKARVNRIANRFDNSTVKLGFINKGIQHFDYDK